jgi:1-aminocyclopropane-1-carboxylate synthase
VTNNSVKSVYVPIGTLDNLTTMAGVASHEKALLESEKKGVKVKALVLCNPHNPLGKSYPPDVLRAYLALCSKYDIHLIRYIFVQAQKKNLH